ncbi:putative quinol monooxygenase [Actinomadura spongiicola]|nr:putative quinol monooxygenase [Actinomadura spongiicola]
MSELILVVSLVAKPETQKEAEEFLIDLLAPTHAEEGCLLYSLHREVEDPTKIWFVERWSSRELLDIHLRSPHIQKALADVGKYFVEGPDIRVCEAIPGGEPAKGSIAGHATGR